MKTSHAYRPDIDGLRALAVCLVVLYHLSGSIIPGGFVGVDVFFVISGFLITGIIDSAIQEKRFSFSEFYSRRFRRILPSLLLVFTFCLGFGWFALFSDEYQNLGGELLYGSIFSSNLFFMRESGYFDRASEMKPLLHLWSLGVEEQFYFFWPVILLLLRGRIRTVAIALLTFASLAYSVFAIKTSPVAVFYLPTSRFWELALGCILALWGRKITRGKALFHDALSWVGLALILIAAFAFNGKSVFPGWRALLPTVGAFLIIAAGSEAWINRRVLSLPILVWVGLISYPLYLWHWPLLYFVRVMESGEPSLFLRVGAVGLAVALAYASYRWLETPIRTQLRRGFRPVFLILLINFAFAIVGRHALKTGNPHHEQDLGINGAGWNEYTVPACSLKSPGQAGALWCSSDRREPPTLALLGDSHAAALFPGLVRESSPQSRWMIIGKPGCALLAADGPTRNACEEFTFQAVEQVSQDPQVRLVALALASRLLDRDAARFLKGDNDVAAFGPDVVFRKLSQTIEKLEGAGKKVAFIVDAPAITSQPSLCIPRMISFSKAPPRHCSISRDEYESAISGYRGMVGKLKAKFPKLQIYDPTPLFCDARECTVMKNGKPYYSYSDHLSDFGNTVVAREFLERLVGKFSVVQ